MNKRIEALADGVFSIAMTLLVLDIRIPELGESVTNGQLWSEILKIIPVFASYALSFGVVGTFWIAHNFVVSQLPKIILALSTTSIFHFFSWLPSCHFLPTFLDATQTPR